jgi:amidase
VPGYRAFMVNESGIAPDHVVELGELCFDLAPGREPRAVVAPGASLEVHTEDAFAGQIREPGDRRDREAMPGSNPLTGPIAVEGARPGDTLVVRVLAIEPAADQCCTYVWEYDWVARTLEGPARHDTRICPIADGAIQWSARLTLPYEPMVGTIGLATPDAPSSEDAGDFGGNLDFRELGPGATLRIPVQVEGAQLYLGDCHARQGDGELTAAALEMAARVTIEVDVERGDPAEGVLFEDGTHAAAVAVRAPLEEAVLAAYGRLARWMERAHGWDRWEAWSLLGQVGGVSLGFHREGIAAAKVPLDVLRAA